MTGDAWKSTLVALAILLIGLLGLYALDFFFLSRNGVAEVGYGDLVLTFRILDAESNKPIGLAEIDVPASVSLLCSECNEPFKLVADENGVATKRCKQCMWFGFSGGPRLFGQRKKTFNTHMPHWIINASAAGYQSTQVGFLPDLDRRTLKRNHDVAKIDVEIRLVRVPEKK